MKLKFLVNSVLRLAHFFTTTDSSIDPLTMNQSFATASLVWVGGERQPRCQKTQW